MIRTLIFIFFLLSAGLNAQYKWEKLGNISINGGQRVFTFGEEVIVCDQNKLYFSTDYGNSWEPKNYYSPASNIKEVFFLTNDKGWAVDIENYKKMIYTSDGGDNWNIVNNDLNKYDFSSSSSSSQANRIQFFGNNTGYLLAGNSPYYLLKTTNSGSTFTEIKEFSLMKYFLKFFDVDYGFVGGNKENNVNLFKTTDGGSSWNEMDVNSETTRVIAYIDKNILWLGGNTDDYVSFSNNGGNYWFKKDFSFDDNGSTVDIETVKDTAVFMRDTSIWYTTDGTDFTKFEFCDPIQSDLKDLSMESMQKGFCISSNEVFRLENISSVNSTSLDSEINLYPNPAENSIIVKPETDISLEAISIYNIYGSKMYSGEMTSAEMKIDISLFPAGVYFIVIGKERQLFIKQ